MAAITLQQAFNKAIQHHQAGRLVDAERLCRQILAQQPDCAEAINLLGIIACQVGRGDTGADLIKRAIALKPDWPEAHCNLGKALESQQQYDQAVAAYRQAIAVRANFPEAFSNLGNVLREKGQLDEAIAAFRQAIALRPDWPEAHFNLGNILRDKSLLNSRARLGAILTTPCLNAESEVRRRLGSHDTTHPSLRRTSDSASTSAGASENPQLLDRASRQVAHGHLDEAIAAYRQAIALRPGFAEAHSNLGVALRNTGKLDEAITAYHLAITLRPNYAEAYYNLGNALKDKRQLDEAITAYRQAITLKPNWLEVYSNLGVALTENGQLDEAIAAEHEAIALNPTLPEGYYNLGNALKDKGQIDQATAAYRKAIALKPDWPEAHDNLALALLLAGNFLKGWPEREWRWQCKEFSSARRNFSQPQWAGSHLTDGTVLLHTEQGFGDTLQFIRYLPLVAERCRRVIVMCHQPQLQRLLQTFPGIAEWIDPSEPLPIFDAHCPFMSLPLAFGTTRETIPKSVPYLHADAHEIERWRVRMANDPASFKVGLVWAGSKTHKNDGNRSVALSILAPLAQVATVSFYSLQKGEQAAQANNPPSGMQVIDWTEELNDFADTAALIANLDLVISVDTAVAHLAGAMGKPVWTLLPFVPDWRWMMDRQDSPWYPTMRLFRQPAIGDWGSVIRAVTAELQGVRSVRRACT